MGVAGAGSFAVAANEFHIFAQLHSAEQKSWANMQLLRNGGTPKNLTSDWLMVTALSSVIG